MDIQKQIDIIKQGTVQIISEDELRKKLKKVSSENKRLRIKYGADPSASDIHLGHTVVLRKLRQLQDLGHKVIFIIGDFTSMIGDPSGRNVTRPRLTAKQVEENAKTYRRQVFKILNPKKTEVKFNSRWLGKLQLNDIVSLTSKYTVARMLERDDFIKRYKKGSPISMVEFLYPLMQGYDSVKIKADVEIGGTDQTFNLLVSREIQREYGQEPEIIITMPILEGTDGTKKMSKSLNNYIGIDEEPGQMYGKIMNISDELMARYYSLLTNIGLRYEHPMENKKALAHYIVRLYWGRDKADFVSNEFQKVFSRRQIPSDMPKISVNGKIGIVQLIVKTGTAKSNAEARRLIQQGGVTLDKQKITDAGLEIEPKSGDILKIGKRNFFEIVN